MARTYKTEIKQTDDNDAPELDFIDYREERKEAGKFFFRFDRMTYRDDAGQNGDGEVITLVNTESAEAVSVWATTPPNALFDVPFPDGVRLMNAITRTWGITEDTTGEAITELVNEKDGGSLLISKTMMDSGFEAWRWTVKQNPQ